MAGTRLRVVEGAGGLVGAEAAGRRDDGPARRAPDPGVFQQECIDAFVGSQVAQGFSQITIDNGTGVLERFLALADKPAWEITEHDADRVIAALVKRGVTQTTRRGYVQAFRGFFGFLEARKAVEIEALFGCRLRDPLDRFNSAPARLLGDAGAGPAADGRAGRRVLRLLARAAGDGAQVGAGGA